MVPKFSYLILLLLSGLVLKSYGQQSCLTQYDVKLTLQSKADSFELTDLHLPSSDSMFSLSIANRGKQKITVASIPSITYENEWMGNSDIFFHLWYKNGSDEWVRHEDKLVAICPVECPVEIEELCYKTIKPGRKLVITSRMNPFETNGTKGAGEYKLQAFYRYKTPCGDYISKSNFLYLKGVQHKPFPKSMSIE